MNKILSSSALLLLGMSMGYYAYGQAVAPVAATQPTSPVHTIGSTYNVRSYGARGDGKTLDSGAINAAIAAASTAGGGTVLLPAGTYLALSIHLKSNIRLHLDQGAVLLAAPRTETQRYDLPEENPHEEFQDFGHSHWHDGFIWGEGLENITIDGPGEIYGKGLVKYETKVKGNANKAISLKLCRNVNISDVTIRHGGWFAILATGVDNLTIDKLKLDTNRDGMDIDCCRNVRISNCSVNSPGDDGICLKSSYALGEAHATENVTISNCFVSGYVEGTLLDGTRQWKLDNQPIPNTHTPNGRIKCGTESNGGFKNITISNCIFDKCRGLALETVDGGLLEDVSVNNITMRDITNAPIFLRLGRRNRGPAGTTVGELRRVNISNVVVYNAPPHGGIIIRGIPDHAIEDVSLSNIQIWFQGGGTKEDAAIVPSELETGYPEPYKMGTLPSYGLYMSHVKGITLDNVRLHLLKDDARPPIALDDVVGAEFFRIKAERTQGTPTFAVKGSSDLTIRMVDGVEDKQQKSRFQGTF